MQQTLEQHKQLVSSQLGSTLYGRLRSAGRRFSERATAPTASSKLICGLIDGENSVFARTMMSHVGRESLMKHPDLSSRAGVARSACQTVDGQLTQI